MASTIAAITTGVGGVVTTADATGNLSLLSGTTTVVAVTSTGAAVTGTLAVSGVTTLTGGLNAALPVLSGGTGVTTSTGTGAVVLGTSPTLTTPALGTPASGILTSCTGLNYNGFKNRIINGAMALDQRNSAASQTFTAAGALAYSVDRWYGYCTGANVTGQQVAGSTTPTNTQFRYRFTGAASVTAVGFGQRIEQKNSYDLAGSTCTLSADLGISATLTTVTWTASYATTTADTFGSLASPTITQIATGTFTVSATMTNFSANISIPAAATTGIQILFTVGALTAGLTWTVGNVQLEKGSTATSFDYRPYGTELALCQRYFQYCGAGAAGLVDGTSSGRCALGQNTFVEMRSAPTLALTSGVTLGVRYQASDQTATSPTIAFSSISQRGWIGGFSGFSVSLVSGDAVVERYGNNFANLSSEL